MWVRGQWRKRYGSNMSIHVYILPDFICKLIFSIDSDDQSHSEDESTDSETSFATEDSTDKSGSEEGEHQLIN